MAERKRLSEATSVVSEVEGSKGLYRAVLITPGQGSSGYYSAEMLKRDGATAFPAGSQDYFTHNRTEDGEPDPLLMWGVLTKTDTVETARNIHDLAIQYGASQVRVDSSGIGGAVYDMLENLPEFANKTYALIGIDNGTSAPDKSRWANVRAWNHEVLRDQMLAGSLDIDKEDHKLRDEMYALTYKMSKRNALQITPKDDLRKAMGGSPDRLDALIYATCDVNVLLGVSQPPTRTPLDPRTLLEREDELVDSTGRAGRPYLY